MMDQVVDILQGRTDELATAIVTVALALACVGTVAMAILEGIKAMVPVRVWFNRWRAREWIGGDTDCRAEFIVLTTGG